MTRWDHPSFAVVGSGALGSYYGARLAQHGYNVRFLMRSDYGAVSRSGLTVRSWEGDFTLSRVHAFTRPESIGPVDCVLVALKATSNQVLPDLLPPLLGPETVVVTLQNGLGNEETLAALVPPERILGGLCFVCINRTAPGVIEHFSEGSIALGEFAGSPTDRTRRLSEIMRASQIPCTVVEDLERARWRKLVWNIPFNGLSIATGGWHVGRILENEALHRLCVELMEEVIAVATARHGDAGSGVVEDMISRTRNMGAYCPSSLIDFLAGKPVELEAIWGLPLQCAREQGVPTPRLETLHALLGALTEGGTS